MRTVLIVEDSQATRETLRGLVAAAGYRPIEAATGEEGLRLALADPPDAALVDQVLPGVTGADLIRLLRGAADPRVAAVPVVGLSGRTGSHRLLNAAGACLSLRKPIDGPELAKALRWAIAVYGGG